MGLDVLRFPKPVLAGCNLMLISYFTYRMRTTDWQPDPIKIRKEPGGWRIVDGRHRVIAAMAAGRETLEAEEQQ